MSDGDKVFQQKLIDIIKSEFPIEKKHYLNNIKDKNFKATAENVHKIKHKISILGLVKGYEIAANYENNLNQNSTKGKAEFESILKLITKFLKTI